MLLARPPVMMVAPSPGGAGADRLLLDATEALRRGEPAAASALLEQACQLCTTSDQQALLALVGTRVDAALDLAKARGRRDADRPSAEQTAAKAKGDRVLMEAVSTFSNKSDPSRFAKSLRLLDAAREAYRAAGSGVEREREYTLGNLYSSIRAEAERVERVAKLLRLKKVAEAAKLKRQRQELGIEADDWAQAVEGALRARDAEPEN